MWLCYLLHDMVDHEMVMWPCYLLHDLFYHEIVGVALVMLPVDWFARLCESYPCDVRWMDEFETTT
jgi:hypothetical protein